MDFAAMMAAQIAKKSTPQTKSTSSKEQQQQKYMRRSEVEAARAEAYKAEQAAREADRQAKESKKRQRDEEEYEKEQERQAKRQHLAEEARKAKQAEQEKEERARRKRLGLPELPTEEEIQAQLDAAKEDSPAAGEGADLEDGELLAKLREMGQPARLFGEEHAQRLRRYQKLCSKEANSAMTRRNSKEPIPTSLEPVPEVDCKIPAKLPPADDTDGRQFLARQLSTWFNLVLREWAIALAIRDDSTKKTLSGQQASNSLAQAIEHLRPLFRKLERLAKTPAELPDDLLKPIGEIVRAAQERRYVHANDGYLQLSIGKAAWPIGVTMVGIHARSAREKISDDAGKAHIMTDEGTRKILQSIKRCLSFAQTRWPPEDVGQLMG